MKKLFTILFTLLLTSNLFSQQPTEKGDLLLEGNLGGVALNSLVVNPGIGIYLSDRFAIVSGFEATLTGETGISLTSLGGRVHFTEDKLMIINLHIYEVEDFSVYSGYVSAFNIGIGYAQRFYFKDWISIQPYTGFDYTIIDGGDGVLHFKSGIGFNLHFERW